MKDRIKIKSLSEILVDEVLSDNFIVKDTLINKFSAIISAFKLDLNKKRQGLDITFWFACEKGRAGIKTNKFSTKGSN